MLKQVIFLYKVIQNEMPDYLSDSQYTRDVNCRPTKSSVCMSHFLYLPQPKTENYKRYIATRLHFFGAKNISQNV